MSEDAQTKTTDAWANAKTNARSDCLQCHGAGAYMYDHNHGTICNQCCRHNMGWWQLSERHSQPGMWCCKAGCEFVRADNPEGISMTVKHDDATGMTSIDEDLAERLGRATENAAESHAQAMNSYGAGYDAGYRDALRRALCMVRGLDNDE